MVAHTAAGLITCLVAFSGFSTPAWASSSVDWGTGQEVQLPADAATSSQSAAVSAISCSSPGNCAAVGQYADGTGTDQGLLLTETSGVWGAGVEASLPADASVSPNVTLASVSCASAGNCTAVGYYDGASGPEGLILSEANGTWSIGIEAPLPNNANAAPAVDLSQVSCPASGGCTAVGRYTDSSNATQGLLLTESGGTWAIGVQAPLPGSASASPSVSLDSVSCATATNCTAVGNFLDRSGTVQGLLLTKTAGSWSTGVEASLPNDSNSRPVVGLDSISCAAASDCTAVGYYLDGSNNYQGLLLTQSSGSWGKGVRAPLPANASQTPTVALPSVSCASVGNCTAVGEYLGGSHGAQGLLLTQTGGSWGAAVQAPLPGNAGTSANVDLPSVSCASAGNCSAVGEYVDSSGNYQGLLLTEASGTWSGAVEATPPAGAASDPVALVQAVSCSSAADCSAGGYYQDSSGSFQAMSIGAAPTGPTLSLSPPSAATVGSPITSSSLPATLSDGSAPTGTITFTVYGPQASPPNSCTSGGTTVGTATVTGNGSYYPGASFTPSTIGTYWWYASYGGDTSDSPADSGCGQGMASTVVSTAATGLTTTALATSSTGQAIHPDTQLAGATSNAGGTITFTVFGPQTTPPSSCLSGGTQVGSVQHVSGNGNYNPGATYTATAPGTYWWYASYSGDANDSSSTSTCGAGMASTVVRNATSLAQMSPSSTGTVGTSIAADTFAGLLSGATNSAGGTITFTVFGPQSSAPGSCTSGGTAVGTATVSGNGTYTSSADFTPSASGKYWWYASYAGDSSDAPSGSTCGSSMPATFVTGMPTTLTAAAPGTGTVGTPIAGSSISGVLSGAASGAGGLIGFVVFGPQSSPPTSCTTGGTDVGGVSVSGNGTYDPTASFTPQAAGTYWWYSAYSGDSTSSSSNSPCGAGMASTVVSKLPTTLTADAPATGNAGSPINASAISSTLAGAATGAGGTIKFSVFGPQATAPSSCATGGTTVGTAPVSGSGSYHSSASFSPQAAGTYWWYAAYSGDPGSSSSSSSCGAGMASTVVSELTPALTAGAPSTAAAGSAIAGSSVTGSLSGAENGAGGTITFRVFGPQSSAPTACTSGGTTVGTATASGNGTYSSSAGFTPTAPGTYWWYASYSGDVGDAEATSPCGIGMASTAVATPPPALRSLKQSHVKWRLGTKLTTMSTMKAARANQVRRAGSTTPVGTTFTFTLNESAKVTLVFTHLVHGRTVTAGTLSLAGHTGNEVVSFQGRLSKTKQLALGSYTVTFTASDSARQTSSPQQLRFTIVS